jgi:hypothetical protein
MAYGFGIGSFKALCKAPADDAYFPAPYEQQLLVLKLRAATHSADSTGGRIDSNSHPHAGAPKMGKGN